MLNIQTKNIDFNYNRDGDITALITIGKKQEPMFKNFFDKLKKDKLYNVEIKEHRQKRSLDANSYMWELCTKIADKLSEDGIPHTKDEIYINAIKKVGVFMDKDFDAQSAKTFRFAWEQLGTGWITEQVDYATTADTFKIRFYYGSSMYNTKQMSKLINYIVEDCKALGIETLTPAELESMKNNWNI